MAMRASRTNCSMPYSRDIAVAAEHLLRLHGVGEADVGQHALEHRRHQAEMVVGRLALLRVAASGGRRRSSSAVQSTRARAASLKARMFSSMRRTSGCTMIGSAGLSGVLGAGQRAALQAVLGVGDGVLIGDFATAPRPCTRDAEPRLVHHHEHGVEAPVLLADQPAGGAVVVHHAGGVAVNAHLVLDRAAGDAVARAERCRRR